MCSVPKTHHVTAQSNAVGKRETNVPSPNGQRREVFFWANSSLLRGPHRFLAHSTRSGFNHTFFLRKIRHGVTFQGVSDHDANFLCRWPKLDSVAPSGRIPKLLLHISSSILSKGLLIAVSPISSW